jgi:type IV secretion system protein TrbI
MTLDPGLRPPPPLAKRLNRNALTVAAVIMGMTVLTAVVVLNPGRKEDGASQGAGAGSLAPPTPPIFLDEPARWAGAVGDTATSAVPVVSERPVGGESRVFAREPERGVRGDMAPDAGLGRRQAFEAALRSPVLAGGAGEGASVARGGAGSRSAPGFPEDRLLTLADSITQTSLQSPPGKRSPANRHRDFLARAGEAGGATVIARLEPAGSPYTLRAGTVIPSVLLTAINSDLPGEIVGQVSRNVYDSRSQRLLLIPKGAKLVGTYDNQVAAGQGRLLVAWTRLILPDGRSMTLPGLPLKDKAGQTGAADRVDHHYSRVFGRAVLLSAISAGAQLSQPRQGSILAAPSAGQVAAGALGQELSNVALEIIRRGMDVAPTITIRQGHPFLVFLNGDLLFGGPYEPEP